MLTVIRQTIIPLLLYLALQIPVFFCGMCFMPRKERCSFGIREALKTWLAGQMLLWAALQVMAVILIQCRAEFNVLFYGFLAAGGVLTALGIRTCLKTGCLARGNRRIRSGFASLPPLAVVLLIASIALILLQVLNYYLGQHIDQDDARWLAEANDALVYGDMMTRNVSTGEYIGCFVTSKDVASPWPMFVAIAARLLHISPAAASHTVYAPAALLLSYAAYALIAGELFKKAESKLVFLLSVSVIHLFYAGTTYTQSVFTMVRIWQGKATVAAVAIPFLIFLAIRINKDNKTGDWLLMAASGCAACLMSGMGISMSAILIGGFGLYSIIVYRRWKRIPLWFLALAPEIGSALLFFYLRGVI